MLDKLKARLRRLFEEPTTVDPARFDDPLALHTEWTPLEGGGASFTTHKLQQIDTSRVEFRPSPGLKLFYGIFVVAGAGFALGPVGCHVAGSGLDGVGPMLFPFVFGLIFMLIGAALLWRGSKPIVFDRMRGQFWKGRRPAEALGTQPVGDSVPLAEIHALQLISELVRGSDSSYHSYELNLVLSSGRRVNVVDHGGRDRIRADAEQLAQFLGCPLWSALE